MGNYFWKTDGISRDELSGGGDAIPQETWNVKVAANAVIERGMLLGGDSSTGEFAVVTSADDAEKVLVIARENFEADKDHTVTQAFASGKFNRERIILGGDSLTLEPFEDALRKSNIHVTSIQDKFGKVEY